MSLSWIKTLSLAVALSSTTISASPLALPKPPHSPPSLRQQHHEHFTVVPRNETALVGDEYVHVLEWAPGYAGYQKVWEEAFWGNPGDLINEGNWNIATNVHVNNEWQEYTRSTQNIQISGGGTVQIVPRISNGQWTSGRLESKYVFTPAAGKRTLVEARIRFGDAPQPNKKGMWPAFWMLGDSIRHGTAWPACGEVDIMERVNGDWEGHATVHCDHMDGGACQEPQGITSRVGLPDDGWHVWRVVFDRTPGNWWDQSMTWYMDGNAFHQVTGARLNSEAAWRALAQSPLFFILNLAVGGNWPGPPNGNTWDSFGNMMEVSYVAHHVSV